MKRLLIATITLLIISGATFWFMTSNHGVAPETLQKLKIVSRFKQTLTLAEGGDAQAQYQVAVMYEHGDGVKKDMRAAVKWYEAAADQAHAQSQFQLGWLYANGLGVRQNYAAAAKWFRLAATFNNHAEAQYQLGEMHFNGRGVEHDYGKAIEYYKRAASQGHAAAQFLLASMLEEGWGVKQDLVSAYMWLKLASAQREQALAANSRYDPVKKLEKLKQKMNQFQIDQAEKRLLEMRQSR